MPREVEQRAVAAYAELKMSWPKNRRGSWNLEQLQIFSDTKANLQSVNLMEQHGLFVLGLLNPCDQLGRAIQ